MSAMRFKSLLAVAAACSCAGAVAQAQEPVSALKGHDSDAPIDVAADRIEVQDRADRAIFVGNVHVTQAELALDTARLTVAYSGGKGADNNVQIRRLDAAGGVVDRCVAERVRRRGGGVDAEQLFHEGAVVRRYGRRSRSA